MKKQKHVLMKMMMMRASRVVGILGVTIAIGSLSGCFQLSVHPLYDHPSDCIQEDSLVGTFRPTAPEADAGDKAGGGSDLMGGSGATVGTADDVWVFSRLPDDDGKMYRLDYQDESHKHSIFKVGIVEVAPGERYMDVFPGEDAAGDQGDPYKLHMVPMHSFIRIDQMTADTMTLRLPSSDWVEKYLKSHPEALKHEELDGQDMALLTASPSQMRQFWHEQKDNQDAFLQPIHLVRQKAGQPDK